MELNISEWHDKRLEWTTAYGTVGMILPRVFCIIVMPCYEIRKISLRLEIKNVQRNVRSITAPELRLWHLGRTVCRYVLYSPIEHSQSRLFELFLTSQ